MSHVVRRLPWCTIDIDTSAGQVFVQLKWKYHWKPLAYWTIQRRRAFHHRLDLILWSSWSNRVTLNVSGTSDFARRFSASGVGINVDVRWVLSGEDWNVTVTKIPRGDFARSSVEWTGRTIDLDTNDLTPVERSDTNVTPARQYRQTPVAHEFGHALGNTVILGRGDEYSSGPYTRDTASMMNIGHELRARHLTTILEELNKMIADTTFSVQTIR
jgi:hypothetical protein